MAVVGTSTYGTGQYVEWTGTTPNIRASHTFMARVKHSSTATNFYSVVGSFYDSTFSFYPDGSFLGRFDGGASNAMEWFRENDSFFGPTFDQYSGATCYGNTTTWYHVALVYNASTQFIRAYIDGTYIGQVASATTKVSSSTSGSINTGATPGRIADFAFFDRALSDGEVASMAAYRVPQVTSGLFLFWRLDSNANDSSGNGRNGSVLGSAPNLSFSTADNPPQPETPTVAIAGAATTVSALSGTARTAKALASSSATVSALAGTLTVNPALAGDAATTSALAAWMRPRWGRRFSQAVERWFSTGGPDITAPWTMMAWARVIAAPSSALDKPLMMRVTTTTAEVAVQTHPTSGLRIVGNDDAVGSFASPDFAPTIGQWYHIAATYDGTTVRGYRDGTEILSQSFDFGASAPIDYIATFAAFGSSAVLEVASAKVWSAQLSEPEVSSESLYHAPHYQLGALFGFWEMAWPAPLADSSGNGHNRAVQFGTATDAQSESPELLGSPFTEIAGTASTVSSLTGSARLGLAFAGSANSLSQLAGALSVAVALQGAGSTTSQLVGDLATTVVLDGAAATTSALTGALSVTALQISGNAQTVSTLDGALQLQTALAAAASTTSALDAALAVAVNMGSDAATVSALAGELTVAHQLAAAAATVSALTGALTVLEPNALAGVLITVSDMAGTLSQAQPLAAQSSTVSALSAALSRAVALDGHATTTSEASGTLGTGQVFVGAASTVSALSGALSLALSLAGEATTVSALAGTAARALALAGSAQTVSALTAALGSQIAGSALTVSSLTGALRQAHALVGALSTSSSLSGHISTQTPSVAAATNTTSGGARAFVRDRVRRVPGYDGRGPRRVY